MTEKVKKAAIYGEYASVLIEQGYIAIPVAGKRPILKSWQSCSQETADILAEHPRYSEENIGILCGAASSIVALDLDNREDIHSEILECIPASPVRKKGAKGQTLFYRYSSEISCKFSIDGLTIAEVLSTGNQTVIPPSIHPDTQQEYVWLTPDTLFDTAADELPTLGASAVEKIREIVEKHKPKNRVVPIVSGADIFEFLHLLRYYDPDDREDWIEVIRIAKHEFGTDEALEFVNLWSKRSAKYKSKGDIEKTWKSFRREENVQTIGSMRYRESLAAPIATEDLERLVNKTEKKTKGLSRKLLAAPGVVGEIADWITTSAIKPQPVLSLAAALAAVATVKSHRVRSETNLRTNMYLLGIAGSASGKEHPRDCIDRLFSHLGQDELLLGQLVSDSGLIQALSTSKGRGIIRWDEIGQSMLAISNRNAPTHEKKIVNILLELFSRAKGTYHGKEYAEKARTRIDIEQPCLTIFGTTTADTFYKSLTTSNVADGFLPRFLTFSVESSSVAKNRGAVVSDPPSKIVKELQRFLDFPTDACPAGNIEKIRPRIVPLSAPARAFGIEADEHFESLANSYRGENEGLVAMWGRAYEHMLKLALVIESGGEVTKENMLWCADVVLCILSQTCDAILANLSDSDFEREIKKLLSIIAKQPGITRTEILSVIKNKYKSKQLDEYLSHLKSSDQILATRDLASKKPGPKPEKYFVNDN